jgi:hypothetical protein
VWEGCKALAGRSSRRGETLAQQTISHDVSRQQEVSGDTIQQIRVHCALAGAGIDGSAAIEKRAANSSRRNLEFLISVSF